MSRNYNFRHRHAELGSDDFAAEDDAASTVHDAPSSPIDPYFRDFEPPQGIPFEQLQDQHFGDEHDDLDYRTNARAPRQSDLEKTFSVLNHLKTLPNFTLRNLITVLFTSEDSSIKNVTNSYLGRNGHIHLLETVFTDQAIANPPVADWIVSKAVEICNEEASGLTDTARKGQHYDDAKSLRAPVSSINVQLLQSFSIPKLHALYQRTTPYLQKFLKGVIGKESPVPGSDVLRLQRNPAMAQTMITSMILNMRSRETNLHAAINALVLWDGRVPKRVVQMLNRYGFCTSYLYQSKAVANVSKDGVSLARQVANDLTKMSLLPYDNFNWVDKAWEVSATHGSVSHDQVSALLVVLKLPPEAGPTEAGRLASIDCFEQTARTRHILPAEQALEEILPTSADQFVFSKHCQRHVAEILCEQIEEWSKFSWVVQDFTDPHAIPPTKNEEYFLPTYDQEQSSTRGNMLVIEHYFKDVLRIPAEVFEDRNFFLLGDRLTTARDRAAQDQRALDLSEHRLDHLSSFVVLSGMMHFVLNQIQNIGKNTWGGTDQDAVSLSTLLEKLPNRSNINLRKIDFYAWLRFFDVILQALVLRAAMVLLNISSHKQFSQFGKLSPDGFRSLCSRIVTEFILPSIDRLEVGGIKKTPGCTESGNAVLLMHDLMTVREIRHAIKHGHPERMQRMLKYWTPMFYAGGSYNYANESMELLHNLEHDWPEETALVLRAGMLMNNKGTAAKFKETDIRVEQFNKSAIVKSRHLY
ncbi:hypothetical protein B0H14DRAFT_1194117 [Mycena olivaceomarginata]|nr:hypothetical protein B0H14DRAFT_1194117 [Mycena olivaceomarginata]